MSRRTLVLALLVLTATSCDQAPNADPSKPETYAVQVALQPAAGGTLQRLALPAEALVALRRRDLGDVRVFDSRGKVVPIALADRADDMRRRASVPLYPVVGPAGALGGAGLSIRIEDNDVARVVTLDSSAPAATGAGVPAAVLLDTRTVRDPVQGIDLDVDIPAGRPVTLAVLGSANLKDWEPLAEKVLFRPSVGAALLGGATIALPGVDLRDRYVGISWGMASGVVARGASVITATLAPPTRIAVATSGVVMADPHQLRFDVPAMGRLAALRLTQAAADGVIPVKLYGRDHREAPWTLQSATTLQAGAGAGAGVLELSGRPMTSYRLEADRRTAGFSAPPRLELLFDPVEVLVALSGTPPYRLAAGQAAARASYLTLAEIAPPDVRLKTADLPRATLAAPGGPPLVVAVQAGAADGALEPRKLLLWAALLLGTLVLAVAALRLLRGTAASVAPKDG